MKNFITTTILLMLISIASAQEGYTHLQLRTGYMHKDAMTFSIGFDFAKKYYTAWELTATYNKSFSKEYSYETIFNPEDSTYSQRQINHSYENLLFGVQYKPLLFRSKNTTIKFRLGAFAGTNFNKFILSPNLGFELLQSVSPKVDLLFINNNGYYLWAEKPTRWRNTAEIGIRIAL